MKRKEGTKRGEEQWEEISWDQALTEIAEKMEDIKALLRQRSLTSSTAPAFWAPRWPARGRLRPHHRPDYCRSMSYLDHYSDYSTTAITQAYPYFMAGG